MGIKNNYFLIGLIILIILIGGFFLVKNLFSIPEPLQASTIEVAYYTDWGPLVGDYEVSVSNEGDVIVTNNLVQAESEKIETGELSEEELKELKDLITEADVFRFKDDYSCLVNCVVDGLRRFIEFNIDGEIKKITNYEEPLPDQLETIIQKIEEIKSNIR